ncbi:hypothetical protein MMC29_001462 [Sticta canariensis]|nr:hypothetical protein [Sticta canariensis]
MVANDEFVTVRKSCLDLLWQHCHSCPGFGDQERVFLQKCHTEIPSAPPREAPASKRRKTLPDLCAVEPTEPLNPSRKSRKKKDRARDSFLQNTPKASQWHKRQIEVAGTASRYEAAIQSLTGGADFNAFGKPAEKDPHSENGLVVIGVKLALLANSALENVALQKSVSYFQALLFLSYCGILEKGGVSYDTVDQLTGYVSCFRELDRRRLRSQALRINLLIHELVTGGWTIYRATELFFINPLSPSYLLGINEEGFQSILMQLTEDEYVRHDFSDCFRPEYTIPGLIAHMIHVADAGVTLPINEICTHLDCSVDSIATTVDRIHKNRVPDKSDSGAPISFVYVSGPESFRSENPSSPPATIPTCPRTRGEVRGATGLDVRSNRLEVAASSSRATAVIMLFHALGGRIPKAFLDRAARHQRRIDNFGEQCEAISRYPGLDQDLASLLDATKLKQNIDHLNSLSIISIQGSTYVCQDEVAREFFEQSRDYWIRQAFMLCCYVFPRTPSIDPLFSSGKELLGILRHILRLYAEDGLELPPSNNTVETLLSASKLEDGRDRENLLVTAARLQLDPPEPRLRAEVVYQLSVMLRSQGRISDSERVITEFLGNESLDLNPESHLLLGLLHLSQANNQTYRFDFRRAREESRKWRPPSDNLSDSELRLLCDHLYCNGRILKGEGRFNEARRCFEGCLAIHGISRPKRALIVSHLSDIYCELDYMQRNARQPGQHSAHLEEGREVVQREIARMRASANPSKGLRRLLLSLVEIELRGGHLESAERIISELLEMYSGVTEPDVNERVGHVQTLIARARISQLDEAEGHWHAALLQNRAYNPQEEEVFTCGVIHLFISSARFQLEDIDGSRLMFEKAAEVIGRKRPQFLIPGIGTYLFDFVKSDLLSRAGWILQKIAQ